MTNEFIDKHNIQVYTIIAIVDYTNDEGECCTWGEYIARHAVADCD